jgi:hypothetical protein
MALGTYSTGTVSIVQGETTVQSSNAWLSPTNAAPGDLISIDGESTTVIVANHDDNQRIEIPAWSGETKEDVPYVIYQMPAARFTNTQIAQNLQKQVAALDDDDYFVAVKPGATAPDPSLGKDGQSALQRSTGKLWVKEGGVWVYKGMYGNFKFSPIPWDSEETYNSGDALPFMGKTWVSLQGDNTGNRPDISPEYWMQLLAGGDVVYLAVDDSDRPATSETVLKFVSPKPMTFYAGLVDSFANAGIGATIEAEYSIRKNDVEFATVTFSADGEGGPQSGTFSAAADVSFAAGDILTIVAPTPRDPTLSTVGITLTAYR